SNFINMLLSFIVVFAVLIVTGYGINPLACLFLPIIMFVEYLICLGMCMLFSALTVYFRDLSNILSIIAMAWQFLTPVMYGQEMAEESLANHPMLMAVWNLNPTTPLINAYREILYYKQIPDLHNMGTAFLLGVIVCVIGWTVFGKMQRGFAEEL
nr:ABC transporter permease [Lachnospiraceae bacterium]